MTTHPSSLPSASARSSAARPSPGLVRPPIAASTVARRHPDRRTAWVIVVLVRLDPGHMPPLEILQDRLDEACATFPLIASRLRNGWWVPDTGPVIEVVAEGTYPFMPAHIRRFHLDLESPVRLIVPTTGEWLLMCAHHFAFDGLSMAAVLRSLLMGNLAATPDFSQVSSPLHPPIGSVRRLCRPADRIAPSDDLPKDESFEARQVTLPKTGVTARLAATCTAAAAAHNRAHGRPINRIGLSIAVGGVKGEAATYRRIDVAPDNDIEAAAATAAADPRVPGELARIFPAAFLLRPMLARLSDTLLLSNLGRLDMPGATSVEFYPVARGRSAVAFGAAGLAGRPSTVTVRARYLDQADATELLERVVEGLDSRT